MPRKWLLLLAYMLNTHQRRWSLFGQFALGFIWLYCLMFFVRCVDRHNFTRVSFLFCLFFSPFTRCGHQMIRSICRINHNNNHWIYFWNLSLSFLLILFLWAVVKDYVKPYTNWNKHQSPTSHSFDIVNDKRNCVKERVTIMD